MGVDDYLIHFRLIPVVFLAWTAILVARAPYQERANRIFGVFLGTVALGFGFDYVWNLTGAPQSLPLLTAISATCRRAQSLAGLVDPPLLLAYALAVPAPKRILEPKFLWASYGLAVVGLTFVGQGPGWLGRLPGFRPRYEWYHDVEDLYVDGTYVVAYVVLAMSLVRETRHYFSRQLFFVALGVGFVSISRTAISLTPRLSSAFAGWPTFLHSFQLPLVVGVLTVAAALAILQRAWPGFWTPTTRALLAWILVLSAAFVAILALMQPVGVALGDDGGVLAMNFGYRWVIFAGVVAFGILRFQIFDLELRAQQACSLLAGAFAAALVAVLTGLLLEQRAFDVTQAKFGGMAAGIAAFFPAYASTRWLAGQVWPSRPDAGANRRRLLEIYEATLEQAIQRPSLSHEERRFVETLKDLFAITPNEHAAVMARLLGGPSRSLRTDDDRSRTASNP